MPGPIRYTADEDAIILRSRSPRTAFRKLGGRRTIGAIKQRKMVLRHPEPKKSPLAGPGPQRWTKNEIAILARRWATLGDARELSDVLPRFTRVQIQTKASRLGLKRLFMGSADVSVQGHKELVDQIRLRSKQDGIALYKLDKILGTGTYFGARSHWQEVAKINLGHVARAIEFFGGTLVIDWCDR